MQIEYIRRFITPNTYVPTNQQSKTPKNGYSAFMAMFCHMVIGIIISITVGLLVTMAAMWIGGKYGI